MPFKTTTWTLFRLRLLDFFYLKSTSLLLDIYIVIFLHLRLLFLLIVKTYFRRSYKKEEAKRDSIR